MSQTRNHSIDLLRVVAALDIILLHVTAHAINQGQPSEAVVWLNKMTRWGVPAFLACSGYLYGRWLISSREPGQWLARRSRRLLIPYAFWSLVYIAMLSATAVYVGKSIPHWDWVNVIFTGAAYSPLWFLPALFYASVVGLLAVTKLGLTRLYVLVGLLAAATIGLSVAGVIGWGFWEALPLFVFTYLTGTVLFVHEARLSRAGAGVVFALVVAGLAVFAFTSIPDPAHTLVGAARRITWYATGPALLMCALALSIPEMPRVGRITPYLIGVYLAHSVWLEIFAWFLPDASMPALQWVAIMYPLVTVTTIASVMLGARFRLLRPVLV
jgi:surface polysaccharide O-acyltransferase-like enzyme